MKENGDGKKVVRAKKGVKQTGREVCILCVLCTRRVIACAGAM